MIKSADWDFLRKERSKIFGYWGVKDGWVDEEEGRIGREILGGEQEVASKEDREAEEDNGVQRVSRFSRFGFYRRRSLTRLIYMFHRSGTALNRSLTLSASVRRRGFVLSLFSPLISSSFCPFSQNTAR